MNPNAQLLFNYLRDIIYHPSQASLDLEKLSEDFRELGSGMTFLAKCIQENATLARALSRGNLDTWLPPQENEIAAPLKDLHAKLKHIAWQAQQVAQGDYQHRIDFMGDFSDAFNQMTEHLEYQRAALLEEIEKGRRKARALEQSNSLLEVITDKISQWIIVMNGTTFEWLFFNQCAGQVLKDSEFEPELHLWMKQQAEALRENGRQPFTAELKLQGNGSFQYFAAEIHPISWRGRCAVAFMFTDVSTEKEYLADLHDIAYTDRLTRLYNRHYGMQELNEWVAEHRAFVLCFVDIDNLKYVNDSFGHSEGDNYIVAVAEALRSFSSDAVLCRLGGDEFMVLAQGWKEGKAKEKMEALRTALIGSRLLEGSHYHRGFSYGLIEISQDNALTVNDLLSVADGRMYEYKHRNKVRAKKKRVP